jgi:predicted enzyme related to lactoylglutathione lyase
MQASPGLKSQPTIRNAPRRFTAISFGWKINPFPGTGDYWHIDTGGADDSPDGALKRRKDPQEPVVNYVSVNSVDKFADKISKLGGKICMAQNGRAADGLFSRVPGSRGNAFGLWESDPAAT